MCVCTHVHSVTYTTNVYSLYVSWHTVYIITWLQIGQATGNMESYTFCVIVRFVPTRVWIWQVLSDIVNYITGTSDFCSCVLSIVWQWLHSNHPGVSSRWEHLECMLQEVGIVYIINFNVTIGNGCLYILSHYVHKILSCTLARTEREQYNSPDK